MGEGKVVPGERSGHQVWTSSVGAECEGQERERNAVSVWQLLNVNLGGLKDRTGKSEGTS